MIPLFKSRPAEHWFLWAAGLCAVLGILVVLLPALGGLDRLAGVAVPLALAAAALAANVLTSNRSVWATALLYAAAALTLLYGMILALALPLRLAVEGVCQAPPAACPLGFDRPITAPENAALYIVVILEALGLLLTFIAMEVRYRRRPNLTSAVSALPPDRPKPPERSS